MLAHDLAIAPDAWAACVLLHPHPDMGGDRHNNVVDLLYRALPTQGVSAVRFDFTSSDFPAARAEAEAALDLLPADGARCCVVGYSFGGAVASLVDDARVAGWALVAPALTMVTPVVGGDGRPKLVLAAEHDQWFTPSVLADATAGWTATERHTVTGTDHFFGGRTDAVVERVLAWLAEVAGSPRL